METAMDDAWRFVPGIPDDPDGSQPSGSRSSDPKGFTIRNPGYAENSRWEITLVGLPKACQVELSGRAVMSGECRKRIGDKGYSVSGVRLSASIVDGDAAAHIFDRPMQPATLDAHRTETGSAAIVTMDDGQTVRLAAEFSGVGEVVFHDLRVQQGLADEDALHRALVEVVAASGVQSESVLRAFRSVRRGAFLPGRNWGQVYRDVAVTTATDPASGAPLSSSSQPSLMAWMLEDLDVLPGMRVLEIGAGTGYNAALLAALTGGGVVTVDIDPETCRQAREHLAAAGVDGVEVVCGDGRLGFSERAPYDRIIVTAQAVDIAPAWMEQLREDGRMVVPVGYPNTSHRSLALRKDGGRLVMERARWCSFMRLRDTPAWDFDPSQEPQREFQHWLVAGQPAEEPVELAIYPRGTAPALLAGEQLVPRGAFDYVIRWPG